MNQIQIAFCDKVNKEYFSRRQEICRQIISLNPLTGGISEKDEINIVTLSQQLVAERIIRKALVDACIGNRLTANQMNHLIGVNGLIDKVNLKCRIPYDSFDKEVMAAAKEVQLEEEESRKAQNRQQSERTPLI